MTREIICILVSAAGTAAVAYTGFYVGRKVSADGTTIIARTALADAKRIFDELSWYLVRMNFNRGDFGNKKSIPERKPFAPSSN